jgi:hypothetical protein
MTPLASTDGGGVARAGRIHAGTTGFPLTEAVDASATLKAGQITGRAVQISRSSPRGRERHVLT